MTLGFGISSLGFVRVEGLIAGSLRLWVWGLAF